MEGTSKVGVSAWALAVIGAFAVSLEAGLMAVVGYAGQWLLHAPKRVPSWAGSALVVVVCAGAFWLLNPHAKLDRSFVVAAAQWALAALGVGSLAGHTAGAPATNSK